MHFIPSYYASQYYSDYKNSGSSESTYVRFNSGFNLLGWQAHADTTFNKTDGSSGEWKSNTLYLERGIAELLGTLRAGDQYTSSEIFDSVRFTGVRLVSRYANVAKLETEFYAVGAGDCTD
ncbi:fimbrial outer membrane usher protein [Salmonella enterica subsp. enterica]|uniref:Fimbrial outer membrane usher protein n=1 Tax=Salmonella enterica I TaxID=59201 RepID=A0A3S4ISG9_SALET|nr:fimbrial outer membrane usher protein [Salmonella enterica subsp. enterica]